MSPEEGLAPKSPTIDEVLNDPATSYWLKDALASALGRDPVDAANDAEVLLDVLAHRLKQMTQDMRALAMATPIAQTISDPAELRRLRLYPEEPD